MAGDLNFLKIKKIGNVAAAIRELGGFSARSMRNNVVMTRSATDHQNIQFWRLLTGPHTHTLTHRVILFLKIFSSEKREIRNEKRKESGQVPEIGKSEKGRNKKADDGCLSRKMAPLLRVFRQETLK